MLVELLESARQRRSGASPARHSRSSALLNLPGGWPVHFKLLFVNSLKLYERFLLVESLGGLILVRKSSMSKYNRSSAEPAVFMV